MSEWIETLKKGRNAYYFRNEVPEDVKDDIDKLLEKAELAEQLESENERLKNRCTELAAESTVETENFHKRMKQLESENKRLRESLEEIKRIVDVTPYREYTTNKIRYRLFDLAKQALRGDNN